MAMAVVIAFFVAVGALAAAAGCCQAAFVEHTFVVSQMNQTTHQGKAATLVTVVNGQLPGPTIEVTEGDSVAVHVINNSPYEITIHWHGVKQRLNCWADGAGMITQCPIEPNNNLTYRFDVVGQEGTLSWHAHVACLRATVHGVLVIRPRPGGADSSSYSYPFSKPDEEIPIVICERWNIVDLVSFHKDRMSSAPCILAHPTASTINGKAGDLHNNQSVTYGSAGWRFHMSVIQRDVDDNDNFVMNVENGKTYLLRIVNAALFSEYYFKVAGHRFTVVAADANYVKPYTTDIIAIAPGETIDALLVANAPPPKGHSYYMVALANQRPKPDPQVPLTFSRGIVQYKPSRENNYPCSMTPMVPKMPDQHDSMTSFYFHGNLTSLPRPQLTSLVVNVDERLFITLGLGSICTDDHGSPCNKSIGPSRKFSVATMNNVSFQPPVTTSLLDAHHYDNTTSNIDTVREMPDMPPRMFNFTDTSLINADSVEAMHLAPTSRGTLVRRFRYNTSVEIVFQGTSLWQSDSNPMHLHGHDFFVLAQGLGNYDAEKDVKKYNLVDPPIKNTVLVPAIGWAAIRFVTNNPGVWYMHCHFEFHVTSGMAVVFEVDDGPTFDTTLPPPPADFPRCDKRNNRVALE